MRRIHSDGTVLATLSIVAMLVGVGVTDDASAQRPVFPPQARAQQPQQDSATVLDQAQDAQRRFERVRVRHLPWQWGSGSGPCDERVGRMCWRHDDPEDNWVKPEDPEPLVRARDDLIQSLAHFARLIPGDRWILAQRVWYLGEADRWDDAITLTTECAGNDARWCAALRGLALHERGRYVEAADDFERANGIVDEMGGDERVALRALLDGRGWDVVEAAGASTVSGLRPDSLMWLLADPMYSVPGNDRRTEHDARRIVNRIRDGSRNPYSLSWGKDMSELVVRYGWAVAWEKVRGSGLSSEPLAVVGRHPSKGRGFIPKGSVLASPYDAPSSDFAPVARHPRTTYRPRYASVIRQAEAEVFVLDRGDSLIFIGALLPPDTSLGVTLRTREGAFAANLSSGEVVAGRRVDAGRWTIRAPNSPTLVSVDRMSVRDSTPSDSVSAAWRYRQVFPGGRRSPDVLRLSDLLFLEANEEPRTPEDLARALRPARVRPGQTITVAWEVYGLGFDNAAMEYEVLVGQKRGGLLATVGGWVGLGEGNSGLLIDWSESQPDDPGPQLRHVSVTFPDLREGTYVVRLTLRLAGRSTVFRERELEVSASR